MIHHTEKSQHEKSNKIESRLYKLRSQFKFIHHVIISTRVAMLIILGAFFKFFFKDNSSYKRMEVTDVY